ncbi:MAG TPA: hypothetical protein VGE11_08185 [Pseudonocardia sp.]
MCGLMWGFPPRIIALAVDHMGPTRALVWFATNMPRYLVTTAVLGPVRVHLACVVAALRNGCAYCAYANVYALELIYFRERGRLFPWDAAALDSWLHLDPRTMRQRLHGVLVEAGLHNEAMWADRILALADGSQQPVDAAEARLAHILGMATTMSQIAVAGGAVPDQAHDPVNKNAEIKSQHAALRAASSI